MQLSTAKIILVMFFWASCFPLITIGIKSAPHLTFATLRGVIAGGTLTVLAIALGRPLPRSKREWGIIAMIGLGATSLGFLGMFHAAEFVTPGIATVVANTQPLMAAVLAAVLLREQLSSRAKIGLTLGFLGTIVLAAPRLFSDDGENYALGVAYIVLAALGISFSNVLIKLISGTVDDLMAMGLQILIGSVPLAAGAWFFEDPASVQWSAAFVFSLLGLGLFGTALAYTLWISALKSTPLNRANAFAFLVPILGLSLGVIFFDEPVNWVQVVGISLAVLGVTLVNRAPTDPAYRRSNPRTEETK